jgi:glycosyltransferase involved in cell wall biosynthesis
LLKALAGMPQVQLLIAGEGEQREALESLAKKFDVDADFLGRVGRIEKARLLAICDAVVLPSLILADGRSEGLPVVALEALAAGRPLIAPRVGGLSEIIRDGQNGMLFEAGNSSQLADKIKLLLGDDGLRQRLSSNAQRTAEAFDWQIIGAKFSEILKDSLPLHGSVECFQAARNPER